MANRTKKKQLSGKYVIRRFALVLAVFLISAVAAGYMAWKAVDMIKGNAAKTGSLPVATPTTQAVSASPSTEPVSGPESVSKPEPVSDVQEPAPRVDLSLWSLILVNSREPLPDDFSVELEAVVGEYKVDTRIAEPLKRMIAQAKEDGISLVICSAYRSIESQRRLYDNSVSQYLAAGKSEEAARALTEDYYAVPGTSEHHTGLAVDIVTLLYQALDEGYAKTPAAVWLSENAYRFGFILRYPKGKEEITRISFEPWHYRYVGEEIAVEIYESGLCLEEYIYIKELERTGAANDEAALTEPATATDTGA